MTEIQAGYVDVRGVRTYVERCGSGQPILCLHTAGRDSRQWQWLMQALAPDFQSFALDYPGHGKSWPLPDQRCLESADEFCAFVWATVEALGLERPIIAGCSVGGNLSLMLGTRHGDALLAVVAMQAADYSPSISQSSLDLMDHPHVSLPQLIMDQAMSLLGTSASDEARAFHRWNVLQVSPTTLRADLSAYTSFDIRAEMGNVRCPVLLIRGEDDWIVPQAYVDVAAARLVNATQVRVLNLPGVGHFAPLEAPVALAAAIREFVAGLA